MKISDLRVLVKIADLQSITAAANQLDISSSAASVSLKRIEESLGAQMFVRTTRKMRLTPEGERYLPICQQALDLLQQGQMLINEEQQSIRGEIRITVSSEMGRNLMRELLNDVMAQHPFITLRLHASDSRTDFYRDGVDVALRAMTKEAAAESNLYGFKICNIPHVLCAAPSYIEKFGVPQTPEELPEHNALLYKLYEVVHDRWEVFDAQNQPHKIKLNSNRAVNDGDIVRRWCIDGVGIAKKSAIDVGEDLIAGRLERFLSDCTIPLTEMWLVLPSRQLISPAIRLIRDELKKRINELRKRLIEQEIVTKEEWPESE
ncbi:LysR family transcriptional regulator [Vibrio alginolyticus]|uniref:LysR family transcriptional regulator n=1 Tax=Vibrio alginolyticus TaxID=663 RepID=UPI001BD2D09C|nr:LysR family transcriptional regulator [Vibrio alginolyticus]MBT0114116.1 LysR family transcriptional regulator [Vibrio alginolyticus]